MMKMTLNLENKMEVIDVFTKTERDTSSSPEVSPKYDLSTAHGYFSNPENFLNQPATHFLP